MFNIVFTYNPNYLCSLYLYSLLNITLNIYNKFHCPQIAEANRGGQLCTII